MKLYEKLYTEIKDKIISGYYQNNQKLPSIRDMHYQQSVSISTVQEAYRLLEDTGFAISKPKSGYYVQQPKADIRLPDISHPIQQPVDVAHWDELRALLSTKNDAGFIAFGRGNPETNVTTLKPLQHIHIKLARYQAQDIFTSEVGLGVLALRKQIAHLMHKSGCQIHPDDIQITTGCQEALSLSLKALTKPGDLVAIDSPSFYGSIQAIKSNGLKVLEIPTHPETGISLSALEMALEQWPIKVIQLIPTSNNPLGYIMPDEKKKRLLKLAAKYDIAIIEDDIYGDLIYQNPRPRSIKSFDTEGRVLMCSSFSKTVAPGLRVGWVAAGQYGKVVTHLKFITSLASATLPQLVMAEFIEQGYYEKHIRISKKRYQHSRDAVINWVQRYFPEGTRMTYPQGGFNLWIELPEQIDSFVLNDNLAQVNIGIAPGPLFSCTGKHQNCFRLNYMSEPNSSIEKAIKTIGDEAKKMQQLIIQKNKQEVS